MKARGLRSRVSGVAFALGLAAMSGCGRPSASPNAATARTSSSEALPFIHDDYPKALAEAKRRNKPLFVDAWAPWCHSCQSLRTFVLTDPSLTPLADDFVWLSVDTDKDVNAEWVTRHPHVALPTLWVVDPATDRPILKWAGTVTAAELRTLLAVSVQAAHDAPGGKSGDAAVAATAAFVRGNHALAAGSAEEADREYRSALAAAAKDHPQRARIVEALVTQLALRKQDAACAELAAAEAESLPAGTSRASVLVAGLGCAREGKVASAIDRLLPLALRDATARDASLLPDDRSALYSEIVDTKKQLGDVEGTRALAHEWVTFLDTEASRTKNSDARASLDPLRLAAYFAISEPARAIPMLEQSERDFPQDYNPPARLARVYVELKRLDDADKAIARAATRVYGPRAMRVLELKADIAKGRGDRASEIAALEQALAKSEHAVLTEGQKKAREGLAKRLGALR